MQDSAWAPTDPISADLFNLDIFLLVYLRQMGKKPLRNTWSTAAKLTIESD